MFKFTPIRSISTIINPIHRTIHLLWHNTLPILLIELIILTKFKNHQLTINLINYKPVSLTATSGISVDFYKSYLDVSIHFFIFYKSLLLVIVVSISIHNFTTLLAIHHHFLL